jgi:Uri superfamily endonuclease
MSRSGSSLPPQTALKNGKVRTPGAYILLFCLPEQRTTQIGRLGVFTFPEGEYAYVGSALSGLEPRVSRHLRGSLKKHWHIDYLLPHSINRRAYAFPSEIDIECELAREIGVIDGACRPAEGFGSSDCVCRSHLFLLEGGSICALRSFSEAKNGILYR